VRPSKTQDFAGVSALGEKNGDETRMSCDDESADTQLLKLPQDGQRSRHVRLGGVVP
jgi:hypothetical protein